MIEDRTATGTPPGVAAWETIGAHIAEREDDRRDVMRHMRFDTIAVHGVYDAQAALANQGSINEPLFLSPAQHFAESDQMETALAYRMPAWTYTRIANPTVHYLEETLALLETYGSDVRASTCATASGMAAVFMATEPFVALDPTLPPPNIVATDANELMCPPRSPPSAGCRRLAFTTIAMAFQRMYARSRSSISRSPGQRSSCSGSMVLT